MTINVEDESRIALSGVDTCGLARRVIEAALDYEGCPYETEVSLLLTNNKNIRQLNQEYRGIDRATDVLSFPMLTYDSPSDFSCAETEAHGCFHPDTGELLLGDIIISMENRYLLNTVTARRGNMPFSSLTVCFICAVMIIWNRRRQRKWRTGRVPSSVP